MGVGEHLGAQAEDTREVSHFFACPHPGYRGWRWSVTIVRAARARVVTINEVVLLPGEGALQAKAWVPWSERIQPRDVTPGVLLPSSGDDPRLEPGYTGGEDAANSDPAEMSLIRLSLPSLASVGSACCRPRAETRQPTAGWWGRADRTTRSAGWPLMCVRPAGSSYACRAASAPCSASARMPSRSPREPSSASIMAAAPTRMCWRTNVRMSFPRRSGTPSNGMRRSRSSIDTRRSTVQRSGQSGSRLPEADAAVARNLLLYSACDLGHKLVTLSRRVHQTRDSRGFLQGPGESPCRTLHLILGAGFLVLRGFP